MLKLPWPAAHKQAHAIKAWRGLSAQVPCKGLVVTFEAAPFQRQSIPDQINFEMLHIPICHSAESRIFGRIHALFGRAALSCSVKACALFQSKML